MIDRVSSRSKFGLLKLTWSISRHLQSAIAVTWLNVSEKCFAMMHPLAPKTAAACNRVSFSSHSILEQVRRERQSLHCGVVGKRKELFLLILV